MQLHYHALPTNNNNNNNNDNNNNDNNNDDNDNNDNDSNNDDDDDLWSRVTHICVNNQTITGSDNGLSPGQAITTFKKMHLKMSSGKWRPFYLDLNVLTGIWIGSPIWTFQITYKCYLCKQFNQSCDHVKTYKRLQNKVNCREIADKQKPWVIVRANLLAAGSMVVFKTLDLRLKTARGHKEVVHDRATCRAGSYHQSRMIVGWEVARLVWRLTGDRAIGRAIYGTVSRLVVRSITISDDWLHDLEIGRATSRHLLVVLY